jgi:MGT family glycosyltransferase
MDCLMTIWDAGGSVPPELAIVRELVDRGHRVVVLGGPPLRPAIEAAGASFRSWRRVPHRDDAAEPDPFSDTGLSGPKVVQLLLDRVVAGPSWEYATEVGAALDELGSQLLVSSMLMLGGMAAAEARSVPFAAVLPNCYLMPCPGMPPFGFDWPPASSTLGRLRIAAMNRLATRLWDRGLPALNATRAKLDLPPLAHVFAQHDAAARVLVLSSRAFDFPAELPPNVRYVGVQLDDPCWVAPADMPAGVEPLVLVGMSSTFMDQTAVLRRVVAALDMLPVRGLVTTGPEIDPAAVAGTTRVRVVRSAPHAAVLPHASVVVNHGGHGTVVKAIAAGVPQLVLPLGRDQPNNAARVVATGTGLTLKASAQPAAIAAALTRLLGEPRFRVQAAATGAILRAEAGAGAAVDELEAIISASSEESVGRLWPDASGSTPFPAVFPAR